MALNISAEQMQKYKDTAHKAWQREQAQRKKRHDRAWQLAHQAATLLKNEYGTSRVVIFGSITHPDRFNLRSDVDLAAWGLTSVNWLKASAAVRNLADDIELNLVDVGYCSPELRDIIESEGVIL